MEELELLSGTVCAIVFQNEENGYTVLKLDSESAKLFAMRVRDDGLYVIGKGGMAILMR